MILPNQHGGGYAAPGLRSGNRGIKPQSLTKLIQAFTHDEAAALVAAHLRDECPVRLYDALDIPFSPAPTAEESAPRYPADKEPEVALEFFGGACRRNPDLRDLLLNLYKVLR